MTRFIVEEGGKRRAFKASEGVITIGSGDKAMLRLASPGVAEVHAELELSAGTVKLRCKPGVLPPTVNGKPMAGETLLAPGASVQLGEARISVEGDAGSAAPQPAQPARPAVAPVATPASSASRPKPAVAGASKPAKAPIPAGQPATRERAGWERSNRELYKDKGLKPLHVLLLAIPAAILIYFLFSKAVSQGPDSALAGPQQVFLAESSVKSGMWDQAEQALAKISDRSALSTDFQARIAEVEKQVAEGRKLSEAAAKNSAGDQFLQTMLKNFESQRLASKVDKPAVRVFLKRVAEFERRWPDHPEMEWVRRKKERYAPMVDLSKPASYADIEFEVKAMTWDNPRNYRDAFSVTNRWLETAGADERGPGLALLDKLIKERDDWFEDRMQEAAHQFKKGQLGQSIQWLAILMTFSGDAAMADRAAQDLIKFHGVEAPGGGAVDLRRELRGYRRGLPEYWKHMEANRVLAEWMRENPLDDKP